MINIADKPLILNRIKTAFNIKSNAELSRLLGVSPAVINNWYARNTLDLELIITKCVDLSLDWLITGKGEIFKSKESLVDGSLAIKTHFVSRYEIDGFLDKFSTEYLDLLPVISILPTTRTFGHLAFEVFDDAMQSNVTGCLKQGDIVIGSAIEKDGLFNLSLPEIPFLIFHKELGAMIRVCKEFDKQKKTFLAVALNPMYTSVEILADDVSKIYYIHQAITRYEVH